MYLKLYQSSWDNRTCFCSPIYIKHTLTNANLKSQDPFRWSWQSERSGQTTSKRFCYSYPIIGLGFITTLYGPFGLHTMLDKNPLSFPVSYSYLRYDRLWPQSSSFRALDASFQDKLPGAVDGKWYEDTYISLARSSDSTDARTEAKLWRQRYDILMSYKQPESISDYPYIRN